MPILRELKISVLAGAAFFFFFNFNSLANSEHMGKTHT